jgi:tRNA 2-thiouridine synthesizing protein B
MRVFLLTKTPNSERTKLCMRLVASSVDVVVYLAGDGVYNLMGQDEAGQAIQICQVLAASVPAHRILVCREDLEARGVSAEGKATVPADFYERLVDDMMREGNQIYIF